MERLAWHDTVGPAGSGCGADDGLAEAAWVRVDAERVVEGALRGFGLGGGAPGQGAAGGPAEGGGDTLLAGDEAAQGGPTGVAAAGAQTGAAELDELVGADGEAQVAVGAPRLAVGDGSQAECGLERTEDGCDGGERGVGAPERVCVPVGLAAAQAGDAGVGGPRAVLGASGPGAGDGLVAGLVGGDVDLVGGGDAGRPGCEAPAALLDLVEALGAFGRDSPAGSLARAASQRVAQRSTRPRACAARSAE